MDENPNSLPRSARRYDRKGEIEGQPTQIRQANPGEISPGIPRRATAGHTAVPLQTRLSGKRRRLPRFKFWFSNAHWMLYFGVGMLAMLALWTILSTLVNWSQVTLNDLHYGRPRIFQTDAVVGHNDSISHPSHFIAINMNRRVEVIEFPGGDISKARILIGPEITGNGADLAPVTLSFINVKENGKPDMIVHVQETVAVFINDNGTFRAATPDEIQEIQQYLQDHGG